MDIKSIISEIEYNNGVFPEKQIEYLINNREEAIPELLKVLEETYENAEELSKEGKYFAHIYAAFLLAQFKEKKGYELLCKIISIGGDIPYYLFGDTITEELANILASLCHGDISLIKNIIENSKIYEYTRSAALRTLVILVARKQISRKEIIDYFDLLYSGKLEREYSYIWAALVHCTTMLHPNELMDKIEKVYEDDLVDDFVIRLKNVKEKNELEISDVMKKLENDKRMMFIDNTINLKHWACFEREKPNKLNKQDKPVAVVKVGRNAPCPCGSGKKYKKCCGA